MVQWIMDVLEEFGYLGVFFMMALENIFPPIPSEVVLPFSGFLTTQTQLSLKWMLFYATSGSLIGSCVLYGFGAYLDEEKLNRFLKRWGKVVRINVADVHRAESWFKKYGPLAVMFGRMIPLVRSLISFPAGMTKMNLFPFVLFTLIGTSAWNTILVTAGVKLGQSWPEVVTLIHYYSTIITTALVIFFLIFLFYYSKRKL
ncbi:DedA family protein [Halobacillus litoralis]|uniref:DedA family protein n=1 Tax=Halobacillus litoralis TaxID=45668 RepID=UPI001CFCDF6F|nr:DedA family protein [Halobacillus litoralis]